MLNGLSGRIDDPRLDVELIHQFWMKTLARGQAWLHVLKPEFYGAVLRVKTKLTRSEVNAIVGFDTRMWYHNLPIEGNDDILFHRDHDIIEQLDGGIVFRDRQLRVWTRSVAARQAWCDTHGSRFRMLIVPEKHVVYSDRLPRRIRISPTRPVRQLLDALGPALGASVLYPVDTLRVARGRRDVFYKTDTHWTSYGAFIGYRALVDSLAPDLMLETVGEGDLQFRERPFIGDIGVRYLPERGECALIADPPAPYRLVFGNSKYGRGAVHIYESERGDLPTCVIFRDSFANAAIPFLMRSFSRVVAVSSLSCHYDLLEQEKPDVVLFEIIERFVASFVLDRVIVLPEDEGGIDFATFSGTKLCELEPRPK